jgi:hypothetical protein
MLKRAQSRRAPKPRRAKKGVAALPPPPPSAVLQPPVPEKPATLPWLLLGLIALWVLFRVHHLAT